MTEPIDPLAVLAAHQPYLPDDGRTCGGPCYLTAWPCEPYRLAEALAAERAKVARVEEFRETLGPDPVFIRRVFVADVDSSLRAALADRSDS